MRAIAGVSVCTSPSCSPDYNPIELAFAQVKARLRAGEFRTTDAIERFFGTVHEAFTPDGRGNDIPHAGYTATH